MRATIELVLILLFLVPGMLALIYAGVDYAAESWSYLPYGDDGPYGEISVNSPAGVPVSPLKTLLPAAAFFVLLQGVAEIARCILCLKHGEWPERMRDVEEMADQIIHEIEEREHKLEHEMHLDSGAEGESK